LIYLTQVRLMLESERTIAECARDGEPAPQRVCAQLLAEPMRYALWHVRHDIRMGSVASARMRDRQILALRAFAIEQIHRAALVRYLRDFRVVGVAREQALRDFHGVVDAREATLAEHRDYLLAAGSQVSTTQLLEFADDQRAAALLRDYEFAYGQFFSMFCERSRSRQNGQPYLGECLLPEVRAVATRARRRVLDADLPVRPVRLGPARAPLAILSTRLAHARPRP
jgi:hypothetical protein